MGAFPQNFSPPSKATFPQLRAITPSPPLSHERTPPSPTRPELGHVLEEEIDEHEDGEYDSRLDPRVNFRFLDRKTSEGASDGNIETPESFGPQDNEDYTRRLDIKPGVSTHILHFYLIILLG